MKAQVNFLMPQALRAQMQELLTALGESQGQFICDAVEQALDMWADADFVAEMYGSDVITENQARALLEWIESLRQRQAERQQPEAGNPQEEP